jgi:hypothetical protein
MPEEDEELVDGEDVRAEETDLEVVVLDVAEEEVEEEVLVEEEIVEEDEDVVPSFEAPFLTVKMSLTASWPPESIIWIS